MNKNTVVNSPHVLLANSQVEGECNFCDRSRSPSHYSLRRNGTMKPTMVYKVSANGITVRFCKKCMSSVKKQVADTN